jgi:chorismate mutase
MNKKNIQEYRNLIDQLDREWVAALLERQKIVEKIMALKPDDLRTDEEREKEVLMKVQEHFRLDVSEEKLIENFFRQLFDFGKRKHDP